MFTGKDDSGYFKKGVVSTPHPQSSYKRRRTSYASFDWQQALTTDDQPTNKYDQPALNFDRFVPARLSSSSAASSAPSALHRPFQPNSTNNNKFLHFNSPVSQDSHPDSSSPHTPPPSISRLIRRCASELVKSPSSTNPLSAKSHLRTRQQCILALDAPGIPEGAFHTPIAWSNTNKIAVVCVSSVYYQDMQTKQIARLCRLPDPFGDIQAIEWGLDDSLYVGTLDGSVTMWKAGLRDRVWTHFASDSVVSLAVCGSTLAVGRQRGKISIFKDNQLKETLRGHKAGVLGLTWSQDGSFLASGDEMGDVYVWDNRKSDEGIKRSARLRHGGPCKALAFCPWSPYLLATGTSWPEGTIRTFNVLDTFTSALPQPTYVHSLNTSVLTLIWSTTVKELLASFGTCFLPPSSPNENTMLPIQGGELTNALAVFSWPSWERIATVRNSHHGAVSCAKQGPVKYGYAGAVFTVSHAEEAMKLWRVWGEERKRDAEDRKRKRGFEECYLR